MPRIEGVPARRAGLLTRVAYWMVRRKLGKMVDPVALYAHHPRLLRTYARFEMGLEGCRAVPAKLKCLAELKVAALVGCPF